MNRFLGEFRIMEYVIAKAQRVLLMAHTRPDSDTVGSNVAFKEYLVGLGKQVDIICFDPFPEYLESVVTGEFLSPEQVSLQNYDVVIGCDSVDRGFETILPRLAEHQVTILIDHHPDIEAEGDIVLIDAAYSSTCELLFNFFEFAKAKITAKMATALLTGIVGDTGNFQHSCTTPRVMEIASLLMKKGAPLGKIVDAVFTNKKISTLKLWGRAFVKAKINTENGMIVSALTKEDIDESQATTDDINQVATILNTVPGTKFSLIFFQRDEATIKGSLRSEDYKGVDVSEIAHRFGGGGHRLASGFEMPGRIVETADGWRVE